MRVALRVVMAICHLVKHRRVNVIVDDICYEVRLVLRCVDAWPS